jgi:hypothetical protein
VSLSTRAAELLRPVLTNTDALTGDDSGRFRSYSYARDRRLGVESLQRQSTAAPDKTATVAGGSVGPTAGMTERRRINFSARR